jgi:LytS/YehU family sensor histidine kinase
VLGVRMGDRLRVDIDVAPELQERRIPPLSLATLVENSIKHGLSSLPEGGTISICAWLVGDRLNVRVADTGVGLTASAGSGLGLSNLRMRLRTLYGDAGGLQIAPNEPRGFAATLQVPSARIAGGHDSG